MLPNVELQKRAILLVTFVCSFCNACRPGFFPLDLGFLKMVGGYILRLVSSLQVLHSCRVKQHACESRLVVAAAIG